MDGSPRRSWSRSTSGAGSPGREVTPNHRHRTHRWPIPTRPPRGGDWPTVRSRAGRAVQAQPASPGDVGGSVGYHRRPAKWKHLTQIMVRRSTLPMAHRANKWENIEMEAHVLAEIVALDGHRFAPKTWAPEPLLDTAEAARRLGIGQTTMRDLTRRGAIPVVRVTGRAVRFRPEH